MGRVKEGEPTVLDLVEEVLVKEASRWGGAVPPPKWTAQKLGKHRVVVARAYAELVELGKLVLPWGKGQGYWWRG